MGTRGPMQAQQGEAALLGPGHASSCHCCLPVPFCEEETLLPSLYFSVINSAEDSRAPFLSEN